MGSKGHTGGGTVQQLPRTTPHISSTHHRLVRQGHHHQSAGVASTLTSVDRLQGPVGAPPLPPTNAGPAAGPSSSSSSVALSNFRDASSSRSLTPHPFVNGTSLKKHSLTPHNVSIASGQSGGHVIASSSSVDGHGRRTEYQSPPSSLGPSAPSMVQAAARHHPPQSQHFYHHQTGTAGFFQARLGSHSKGGGGGGGSDGGGGGGGGRSQVVVSTNPLLSPVSTAGSSGGSSSNPSAAASFFARAAQKVGASSKKKKHRTGGKEKEKPTTLPSPASSSFPTNFATVLLRNPPPVPRNLLRPIGRMQNALSGKVRVMLRVCPVEGGQSSFLTIDSMKNQVTAFDPSTYGAHSTSTSSAAYRRPLPPKMFGFDAVFAPNDPLSEICATSLVDILQAVVSGADGCLFCYGHARIGKTYTMVGDESPMRLGMIPSAISWLFRLINEQKEHTGARFSVRVSAVEVTGKQEVLKDLLADIASAASASESSGATSPGMYLREDPVCGTQLENQSELRAPTAERAAYFLDAAIAARTVPEVDEDARNSHLLFTIHVYQYRVETTNEGHNGVAGGRSRLHLIDFGSCSRNREGSALSLSALGTVVMALLNGQRHVPYRESTLTQLVKESLGSLSCHACMIVHVSPALQAYNETLQVMQLATRLQRMRTKRRSKFSSTSSEDSSCDENARIRSRMRLGVRMGTLREGSVCSTDYTSSSEQSCDTVIYMGENGQWSGSDRDFTDCEGGQAGRGTAIPRPRFTPPSGLVKTSSLTRVEEIIDGRNHSTQPSYSIPSPYGSLSMSQHQKGGGGGGGGGVSSGKSRLHKFVRGFTEQELLDNDLGGNKVKDVRCSGSGRSIGGERWIDGPPGSMFQNHSGSIADSEQWVDGPPEFRMDTGGRPPEESSLVRSPAKGKGADVGSHQSSLGSRLFFGGGGGASRIPHKAARTAKIAMLYKRETSPGEEEGSSVLQGKHNSRVVVQSEMDAQSGQSGTEEERASSREEEPSRPNPLTNTDLRPPDCIGRRKVDEFTEDCGNASYGGITSLNSGGKTCENAEGEQDEECRSESRNKVTDTNIDEDVFDKEQLKAERKMRDCDEESQGLVALTSDGGGRVEGLNCMPQSVLYSDEELHEDEAEILPRISDDHHLHSQGAVSSQNPGEEARTSGDGDAGLETTERSDGRGEEDVVATVAQPRRSSALKLDIESLFLQNRESVYELQMDEELEHGSRESLQRLIYGSDDDASGVWNSEEAHVVDERSSNPFLDALSLATFNDLLGQSGNHLLQAAASYHEDGSTLVGLDAERSREATAAADDDDQVDAGGQSAAAATEAVESEDVTGVSEEDVMMMMRKSPSDSALCSIAEDSAALIKLSYPPPTGDSLDPSTSVTSLGLVPMAASTPIKPSCLRLPTGRITSSKVPASPEATKSESSRKPPPTPRTSSLGATTTAHNKSQLTNNETNAASDQSTTNTTAKSSSRNQSKISSSSSVKESSSKSGDEKSTGIRRLTTFGFKSTTSLSKPPVPNKTSSNNSGSSSSTKKKSPVVVVVATPKIPAVPASPAMSTKSAKQSRIALPTNSSSSSSTKKSNGLSSKATSDTCAPSSAVEKGGRLMSPYHLVTKPRISVHSSSGHGSDGSSVVENRIVKSTSNTSEVEVSSGYESMIRDSEVTGTSSSQDSNSECTASSSGKGRGIRIFRKKAKGRSRSAPARWNPVDGGTVHVSRRQFVQSRAALAFIGRQCTTDSVPEEVTTTTPIEIKTFNSEDVERMSRWRKKEAELQSLQERRCRIQELLTIQSTLRRNLARSKEILMVDRDSWNYDLNVAEKIDRDDPDYLVALEKETAFLQKRTEACKSRIMIVTCFDVAS